jgi:hypothetical protein
LSSIRRCIHRAHVACKHPLRCSRMLACVHCMACESFAQPQSGVSCGPPLQCVRVDSSASAHPDVLTRTQDRRFVPRIHCAAQVWPRLLLLRLCAVHVQCLCVYSSSCSDPVRAHSGPCASGPCAWCLLVSSVHVGVTPILIPIELTIAERMTVPPLATPRVALPHATTSPAWF